MSTKEPRFVVKPTVNDLYTKLGLVAKVSTASGEDKAFCHDFSAAQKIADALNNAEGL